jgi:hypothetical protein
MSRERDPWQPQGKITDKSVLGYFFYIVQSNEFHFHFVMLIRNEEKI